MFVLGGELGTCIDESGAFERGTRGPLPRLRPLARLEPAHPLYEEVPSAFEREDLGLCAEHMHADRAVSGGQQLLPILDAPEHERHQRRALELAAPRVDPDDRLVLLGAQEDHVVIRGHDDLVGRPRVLQDDRVIRTAWRRLVTLVADVARSDAELPQRAGDAP